MLVAGSSVHSPAWQFGGCGEYGGCLTSHEPQSLVPSRRCRNSAMPHLQLLPYGLLYLVRETPQPEGSLARDRLRERPYGGQLNVILILNGPRRAERGERVPGHR